jgi:hypothetical protein
MMAYRGGLFAEWGADFCEYQCGKRHQRPLIN